MSETIIKLELVLSWVEANISKQYRLGQVGTLWLRWLSGVEACLSKSTLRGDLQSRRLSWSSSGVEMGVEVWWHTLRGKEDPTLKIGQSNRLDLKSNISDLNSNLVWALKDINLEVKQGEILGIIGKNGSGNIFFF